MPMSLRVLMNRWGSCGCILVRARLDDPTARDESALSPTRNRVSRIGANPEQEPGQPSAEAALSGGVATEKHKFRIGGCQL